MNMKRLYKYLILIATVFWNIAGFADTYGTPESVAIQNIKMAIGLYSKLHGVEPTNWSQIGECVNIGQINSQCLINGPVYPIEEHYVFVRDKVLDQGATLFLIRISPDTNAISGKIGRYLIFRTDDGYMYKWMAEANVQKMLAAAGVTELPKPEPWVPLTNSIVTPSQTNAVPPRATTNPPASSVFPKPARTVQQTNPAPPPSVPIVSETAEPPSPTHSKALIALLVFLLGAGLAFILLRSKK